MPLSSKPFRHHREDLQSSSSPSAEPPPPTATLSDKRRPRKRLHKESLFAQHFLFTHGGNFWRDNYLLERWDACEQPVVYLGDTYNDYTLRRRLGDWCWLTRDPVSGYGFRYFQAAGQAMEEGNKLLI